MICRIGSVARSGPAVTVEQAVDADRLLEAIVRDGRIGDDTFGDEHPALAVDCESPTAVHEYVGHLHPEMGLRTRTALAAAGRTRGLETPHDEEIAGIEGELASLSLDETDLETRRRERADEHENRQKMQEAVATTRGRLAACRERGLDTGELEARLAQQIRELAEIETTATAAVQSHERERRRARTQRDRRERRFRLEDRLANRRRDARRWLVGELESEFATRVRDLATGPVDDPFECRPPVVGLAIAELAEYRAPVVLELDRFESTAAAAEYLGGPVVRV
ncbi:MAG: hypothetical protein ACI8TL_000886 [Natronomonas sp.]|jgi:hypothetical protein